MVMQESFRTIKRLPENKDPQKQHAIEQAMGLLAEVGVIDSDSLPLGAIRLPDVTTTGMSNKEMVGLADATIGLNLGTWGRDIVERAPTASKEPKTLSPLVMDAHTMGIRDKYPKTNEIWEKAEEFGDRVTAEEMLRIAIEAAKGNIQVEIGKPLVGIMEPVADSGGNPHVLYVVRLRAGLWLSAYYANPAYKWNPDDQFVVSSRKVISS